MTHNQYTDYKQYLKMKDSFLNKEKLIVVSGTINFLINPLKNSLNIKGKNNNIIS